MKNYWIIIVLGMVLPTACKEKKEEQQDAAISAIAIIKGQLHELETSMNEFKKIERNGNKNDTTYLRRDEIKKFAEPFLSLPDITDKKYIKKYIEDKLIDAQQETLNITTTLKDGEEGEIQKQIIIVGMADISSGKVQSIFIDRTINSADSTIDQKLFWQLDKYFTIGSIVTKENQPEKTYYSKVEWQ